MPNERVRIIQPAVAIGCTWCICSDPSRSSRDMIAVRFMGSSLPSLVQGLPLILLHKNPAYAARCALCPRCFESFFLQSETFHLRVPMGTPRAAAIS